MRSVRISAKHARELLAQERFIPLTPSERAAFDALRRALAPRPVSSARRKTAQKRETKKAETARIRAAVSYRAGRFCECGCDREAAELDHFFGRGKEPQTVENCWLLSAACHFWKTNNVPSAEQWLRDFIRHAEKHGYSAAAAKARARLDALQMIPKEAARAE